MKRFVLLLLLAGCVQPPVAKNFDEDSVTVEHLSATVTPEITDEATRLCAINGRKAVYLGTHLGDSLTPSAPMTGIDIRARDHEFACVKADD